jgi:ribokinase
MTDGRPRGEGKVVVFGSACVDLLMQPDRLPRPGVTVLAPTYELLPGGKGANQAHACAMACEKKNSVHFVGAVGKDAFGDSLRAAFLGRKRRRLRLSHTLNAPHRVRGRDRG